MVDIAIRQDHKRGCGWRQKGGLYLIGSQLTNPCGKLPLQLNQCDICGFNLKPCRSFTEITIPNLFEMPSNKCECKLYSCSERCLMSSVRQKEKALLLWCGENFYPTPESFLREATELGISRRVHAVPKTFKLGQIAVFIAHRKAISVTDEDNKVTYNCGIICAFIPQRIEYVVKDNDTDRKLEGLTNKGVTLVKVERI